MVESQCEELEMRLRLLRKSGVATEEREELKALQEKRAELRDVVNQMAGKAATEAVAQTSREQVPTAPKPSKKPKPSQQPQKRQPSAVVQFLKGSFVKGVMRTFGGVVAISIYFADLISDVQVLVLLWSTGNYIWSWMSIFLLVAQFLVVYLRVIPYLVTTFGRDSALTVSFIWFGFPLGLFLLDGLMFLEPFGLLALLPFPEWLRQFVPAYKATRIIAEVAIESLPQCILQAYIYTIVIQHTAAGTASESEMALMEFASLLPKSILISIVAMLKTWIELVLAARQAGLTVGAKAVQLWQVGAGLPLDALKKGAILDFSCPYHLQEAEIPPLLDALGKNASLIRLDMSKSGLTWSGPSASAAPLVETVHKSAAALSELDTLCISQGSRFQIPIQKIRLGMPYALEALRAVPFFAPGGPWREEILLMGDLLRTNLNAAEVVGFEEAAGEQVAKLMADARKGKVKQEQYHATITRLMADGNLRRGHLVALVHAEVLRDIAFKPRELLSAGFRITELRRGGYTAAEMRSSGLRAHELRSGGYAAAQLRAGQFPVGQLKQAGYSALELKEGGYQAHQLKAVGFTAEELKENGFSAEELRLGSFT